MFRPKYFLPAKKWEVLLARLFGKKFVLEETQSIKYIIYFYHTRFYVTKKRMFNTWIRKWYLRGMKTVQMELNI